MERMDERILILEDNIENFGLIYQQLRALGYHGDNVYKFSSLRNLLSIPEGENKVVIAKYTLLGSEKEQGLQTINAAFATVPVIVTADMQDAVDAAELMKSGAQDCLINGQFNHETLGHTIHMSIVRQGANVHTLNTANTMATAPAVPEEQPEPTALPEPKEKEISDHKDPVAEQITITTENNYQLFDESPIPMWIYDLGTSGIVKVNAAAIYHYGYSMEEFLAMNIRELRVEGDKAVDVEVVKIPLLNSFYNSSKRRHIKKNGDVFYVQVYAHTILYLEKTAGMMMALDINTRYESEVQSNQLHEIIKNQNDQFDNILSSVSEVIWSCSADDSRVLYINKACVEVYGYTPEELMENAGILPSLTHPDDIEKLEQGYMSLQATGHMDVEYRVYDKDGGQKRVVTKAVLRKGEEGTPGIVNGVTMNVTNLREIENKLRDTAREMETIMESITDGFFAINSDWEFTYVNREFERILHLSGPELIGKNIWETLPDVEEMQMYAELYRASKEHQTVHFEEYFPPLKKWLSVNAYPAKDGLAVYFRDVTEEKQRILKIEEQNKKLTEIAWLQSHKVRGPVASILGLVQLFNYDDPADPVNKEILEGIKFATNGMDDIIKEVVEKTTSMGSMPR
jgi:PAS domain S-box-containing protein